MLRKPSKLSTLCGQRAKFTQLLGSPCRSINQSRRTNRMEEKQDKVPSPRIPLQMQVEYRKSYGRQNVKGTLKNISLTGAFLETETMELAPEDKVVLELVVSERRRKMAATIIWKASNGCG